MGEKRVFQKVISEHLGCSNKPVLARFEPVLTEFSPFHHWYAPLCALRTYLRDVWCSHLELAEGCRLEDIYIYIYMYVCVASGCLEADWVLAPDMECRHGIYLGCRCSSGPGGRGVDTVFLYYTRGLVRWVGGDES